VENDGSVGFTVELEDDRFDVLLQLEGKHFVHDALAAVSVGLALEIPAEMIAQSLKHFENMDGRQEIREYGGITVIQDYYNAGPESMAAALNVLGNRTGRKIAVLGDMLELGMCAAAEHYKIGRIAAEKADVVFAYGPNGCRVVSGARTGGMVQSHSRHFEDKDELADVLKHTAKPGDVILIKGSHGMHMEEILHAFLKEET
jgi:UDP-N-acetylmuramoyl-tripeptide--D-alanyl-D-alanine ligase